MDKRRKRIIILACGIFAVALTWALVSPREPELSYQGRTVSEWLDRIDKGQWGAWDEAPIRALGTNLIPSCLEWISYEHSPLRERIVRLSNRISSHLGNHVQHFANHPGGRANRVVCVFGILGPQARTAIPELTRLARTSSDPMRATRCVNSLGFIGTDAIPSLLTLATNGPPRTRGIAIWKLADFGTNAVAAVPVLRLALTDTDPWVTNAANKALLKIAPETLTNAPSASEPPPRDIRDHSWF